MQLSHDPTKTYFSSGATSQHDKAKLQDRLRRNVPSRVAETLNVESFDVEKSARPSFPRTREVTSLRNRQEEKR